VASLINCIDSIIPQYYEGLEVIVIDDHSSDATKEYMQQLSKHNYIRVIYNKENRGVNFSRNRGIEAATRKYILFLDSDDELVPGGLQVITQNIEANPEIKQFLFVVSDRAEEFEKVTQIRRIQYEDWVRGEVAGDFTHVVYTETMKKYLFFEEFRMFEHLNWLRVKKETAPQLLIPVITTQRERNRTDSLTSSSKLKNVSVIKSKFEAEKLYYTLYHKDLHSYNPRALTFKLIEAIVLGAACNQKKASRTLIKYADKLHIRLLGNAVMMLPSSFLKYGIIKFSSMKSR
jgi:glycosyltransferase involved in cell wall biosynthesis